MTRHPQVATIQSREDYDAALVEALAQLLVRATKREHGDAMQLAVTKILKTVAKDIRSKTHQDQSPTAVFQRLKRAEKRQL